MIRHHGRTSHGEAVLISSYFIPTLAGAHAGQWRYRSMLWQRDGATAFGEPRETIDAAVADADAVIAASKPARVFA
jgi:hypothetical protein